MLGPPITCGVLVEIFGSTDQSSTLRPSTTPLSLVLNGLRMRTWRRNGGRQIGLDSTFRGTFRASRVVWYRLHASGGVVLAKIECSLIVLVLVGCGSKSNNGKRDAGISHDAAAVADSLMTSDVLAPSDMPASDDPVPDAAGSQDGVADAESPRDDLLSVEAAVDRPVEGGPRDLPAFDSVMPGDQAGRDHASESQVADAAAVDGAVDIPPEAARDVLPFAVDGPLASFCSGDSARMVVNGIESRPVVSGLYYLLSCCSAGAFTVATATFIEPIAVAWQDWGMTRTTKPVTFDLANLPTGFVVRVAAGCDPKNTLCTLPCDPKDTGCTNLGDGYNSGFTGVLAIAPTSDGFDTSLCLHVEESAGSPHTIVHSLDLYAPHVQVPRH
jgi:hypothetical protein